MRFSKLFDRQVATVISNMVPHLPAERGEFAREAVISGYLTIISERMVDPTSSVVHPFVRRGVLGVGPYFFSSNLFGRCVDRVWLETYRHVKLDEIYRTDRFEDAAKFHQLSTNPKVLYTVYDNWFSISLGLYTMCRTVKGLFSQSTNRPDLQIANVWLDCCRLIFCSGSIGWHLLAKNGYLSSEFICYDPGDFGIAFSTFKRLADPLDIQQMEQLIDKLKLKVSN